MTAGPAGSIDAALAQCARWLDARPDLTERQAREILSVSPTDPRARMYLGAAARRLGQVTAARQTLEPLAREQPRSALTFLEWGLTLAMLGQDAAALSILRRAANLNPDLAPAWRAIAERLDLAGDSDGAAEARAREIQASVSDPVLRAAAEALLHDRLAVVERLLRERLKSQPNDIAALRMLAEAGVRLGRLGDAEALLTRAVQLAPDFDPARFNLALVLQRAQKAVQAIPHLERLLAAEPRSAPYQNLLAVCLGMTGDQDRAIEIFESLAAEAPDSPWLQLSLGHALRTAGRREQAVAAYNRALALRGGLGAAYWSLANLKNEPFSDEAVAEIEANLADEEIADDDRIHLGFALGKAREDAGEHAAAFSAYADAARLRRRAQPYDAEQNRAFTARCKDLYTEEFFAARAGADVDDPAPVFIVGLPRSGSTLIEQILASHSAVEGTMELPDIPAFRREIDRAARFEGRDSYPEVLASFSIDDFTAYGRQYLAGTAAHRKLGRPRFIDKLPHNFQHIGFIRLMLPRAKIIDARRHPMAACFGAFKQHFARGHDFSYDLTEAGLYYRDYVGLMAHWDAVQPGAVHRVIHEDLVEDTEAEVRRLLAYLGLEFEAACLRFYDNPRAVRTASSEQVRRPISREGLEQWRNFEPWLGPLKEALGPVLDDWRG
jgi:predicted Zn-dependent protease